MAYFLFLAAFFAVFLAALAAFFLAIDVTSFLVSRLALPFRMSKAFFARRKLFGAKRASGTLHVYRPDGVPSFINSFPDAEAREDATEQIFGRNLTEKQ